MGSITGFLCYNVLCFSFLTLFPIIVISGDTITANQSITNGQTLVSAGGDFELGFFSPGDSKWYVGIWYKNIPKERVVWVANRDNPILTNSSGSVVKIGDRGNIVIMDEDLHVFWSTNESTAVNPVAQLLDTGNLVVREDKDADPENYLWQSFDYLTDTLLPGMKLGWDQKREKKYRSGPWNGVRFSGVPEMKSSSVFTFDFEWNQDGAYYSYELTNKSITSRLMVSSAGSLQRYTWIETRQVWNLYWFAPKDQCDDYRECGPYGICDTNSSPKTEFDCNNGDGFLALKRMKLPETGSSFVDKSMSLKDCEMTCRKNCSCTGYANPEITSDKGCIIWTTDLLDMREYAEGEGGQDLYIRVAASELGSENGSNKTVKIIKVTCITVGSAVLILGLGICYLWKRKKMKIMWNGKTRQRGLSERSHDYILNEAVIPSKRDYTDEVKTDELELPLFDFGTIVMATNNFSDTNKLGQGGFGCVYKGMLLEGEEIAVKRLAKNSGQGIEEFMNEVRLIARLQHRNLVQLLGCCVEMEEKMLIYEYMQNRSLDSILFDEEKSSLLDWGRRFNIICGVARGLLYLHQDSRFRIIHRDLKASNVLLDGEMNPKISDFGMARIFGRDQTEANTKRVVGTYGYMSPEYAMDGLFSVKSDVFSFGVLVLEIISGKKNRGFYHLNDEHNLLGHAWRLWREGKGLELMDSSVSESCAPYDVLRCIQVGLLCVQEHAEDRPVMSSVVLMLSSETATLPLPKNPGFCLGRKLVETDSSSSKQEETFTVNQVTVTVMDAR
ncbi:Receptor-like serine/threonine-protein kinase SD1-8 [Vitis vinifera]|uniref:Receptor-like serine/threonine-protein kinase n=3 Tax=Vitis vinifera TaxID=29760 RepID=A0A438BSC1_VITVI|nr:Receptor-like serine/threonine-protein kinase SD1-8 [Vitis vinifera]